MWSVPSQFHSLRANVRYVCRVAPSWAFFLKAHSSQARPVSCLGPLRALDCCCSSVETVVICAGIFRPWCLWEEKHPQVLPTVLVLSFYQVFPGLLILGKAPGPPGPYRPTKHGKRCVLWNFLTIPQQLHRKLSPRCLAWDQHLDHLCIPTLRPACKQMEHPACTS